MSTLMRNPRVLPDPDDSDLESETSSEEVTEDEHGEELTPALDAAILRTLGRIKRRDGVYSSEDVLTEALREAEARARTLKLQQKRPAQKTEKPFLLADHHRAKLLSNPTDLDDEPEYIEPLTNVQSERLLRAEAVTAFRNLVTDEQDDAFEPKKRDKDDEEVVADDEEYRTFLLEMGGGEEEVRRILGVGDQPASERDVLVDDDEAEVDLDRAEEWTTWRSEDHAKRKQKKSKADDDFLMNYILNRGWIDRTDRHVPTFDEVVREDLPIHVDGEEENKAGPSHPWGTLEEDDFDDKADEFEAAYNFRFEEPNSTSIATHPRVIPTLVRRPDDARKVKREARTGRKAAEKAAEEEETRRLKGKKRREAEAMLEGLKKELGDKIDWEEVEKVLEGEWDEAEWERIVGSMLSIARDVENEEEDKPTWDDELDEFDDEEVENGNGAREDVDVEKGADDQPINMDADFIDDRPAKKRKKDKKGRRRDEDETIDDVDLTIEDKAARVKQAMDQYKALDHDDRIGDLPTRFKYSHSAPNSFGLSPVEILLASDAELNAIAPVKTIAPYRRGMGMAGKGLGKRVRDLKGELRKRRWGEVDALAGPRPTRTGSNDVPVGRRGEGEERHERKGKRLGRKERMKMKVVEEGDGIAESVPLQTKPLAGINQLSEDQPLNMANGGSPLPEGGRGEAEGKKRRKKKKKDKAEGQGLVFFD